MTTPPDTLSRWCPLTPTGQQAQFLAATEPEVLFGPGAGGGKTTALLMAALEYVDTPGYSALVLRDRYEQLTYPGGIWATLDRWLLATDAFWRKHSWHFPSGAVLRVDYAGGERDIQRFTGGEYHFIGLDQADDFSERQYFFLMGRLRRPYNVQVPLRMRLTLSEREPGEPPSWVEARFLIHPRPSTAVIPCDLAENPYLTDDGLARWRRLTTPTEAAKREEMERYG